MPDTQWPSYEVFIQERPGLPHRNVGAVHAVDQEMALLNARTVFVRRPRCHSLWVVPATSIFACTNQEIGPGETVDPQKPGRHTERYLVCLKRDQRRSMTYVTHAGEVEAGGPGQALALALQMFSSQQVFVWWVFPAAAVTASNESDIGSLFQPAEDKQYRQQTNYPNIRLP